MSEFEKLLEKAVENINQANKHRVRGKNVELVPVLLEEAEGCIERAKREVEDND